jgi:hypothetical protein
MQIGAVLAAGQFVSTVLRQLGKRNEPEVVAGAGPPETSAAPVQLTSRNTAALGDILAQYDVTDISPRDFSEMIQKLYEAGALADQQFQELSLIRVDLDLEGVDPHERLDLLDFYLDKLRDLHRDLEDLRYPAGSASASQPPAVGAIQRRLEWLEKFALIQAAPEALRLDTAV